MIFKIKLIKYLSPGEGNAAVASFDIDTKVEIDYGAKSKNTPLSQYLRKNQTKEEAKLWYQFLRKYPCQFRRQYKIGDYIVDFYCHKAKLAVELDGSGHYEPGQMEKDRIRTDYINQQGVKVLRFTNTDIQKNFYSVCTVIDTEVKKVVF